MKLYLINTSSPQWLPPTWHGGWTTSPGVSSYTDGIDPTKWSLSSQSSTAISFTGTGPHTMALRRLVSRRLAPQTISGTLDVLAAVTQNTTDADFVWRCYAWVSVGETDVERGTLLNYTEVLGVGGATEFPTTRTAKRFAAAQALSSVNAQEGDRIVVEIGISTATAVNSTHTGSFQTGAWGFSGAAYADLTNGETPTTNRVGYLEFSNAVTLSATEPTNISPDTAISLTGAAQTITATPTAITLEYWYRYTAAIETVLTTFAGRSVGGTFESRQSIWLGPVNASFDFYLGSYFSDDDRPFVALIPAGTTFYYQIEGLGSAFIPTGTMVFQVGVIPILTGTDLDGMILVQSDDTGLPFAVSFAYVIDPASGIIGVLPRIPPAENSAFIGPLQRWATVDGYNSGTLYIYDSLTFTIVATIPGVVPSGFTGIATPIAATLDTFYIAQYRADLGATVYLQAFSSEGVAGATWNMTAPSGNAVWGLGVSMDGAVAYYTRRDINQPVKRWDLIADVALADLVAGSATSRPADVMVLADDTILVLWQDVSDLGPSFVQHYAADGTVLHTYDPAGDSGYPYLHHIRQGVDDPLSFWAWTQNSNVSSAWRDGVFAQYRVADGVVLQTQATNLYDAGYTGPEYVAGTFPPLLGAPAQSCPLTLIRTGGTPEPPEPPTGYGTRTVPQRRLRRAPHLADEQRWMTYDRFQLDLQTGVGLTTGQGVDPQIMLRWSNDGGHTWSNEHWVSAGRMGATKTRAIWRQTGRARTRTFEVVVSDPCAFYLAAAYIDVSPGTS